MLIKSVQKNSIGSQLKIKQGDKLVGFNGSNACDFIDYQYYNAQEVFSFCVVNSKGKYTDYDIEKEYDEDLGLDFYDDGDKILTCKNNCVFCFINQNNPSARKTVLVKDDDYRYSNLTGNYVTLTNVTDADILRITEYNLSPLYVSVHSTDLAVRNKMLGNKNAPDVLSQLKALAAKNIKIHAQIVYCPGFNDDYITTIKQIRPYCSSCAIVPIGLTKFSKNILTPVDSKIAKKVLGDVHLLQSEFLKSSGSRFIYAADEFYVLAKEDIPADENYENYSQISNGVGLLRQFIDGVQELPSGGNKVSVITGAAAESYIKEILKNTNATVYAIKNNYFGESVTVAGLVVGSDIIEQLKDKELGEKIIIPRCMLKEFNDIFLDNVSVSDVSAALNVKVEVCEVDSSELARRIVCQQ